MRCARDDDAGELPIDVIDAVARAPDDARAYSRARLREFNVSTVTRHANGSMARREYGPARGFYALALETLAVRDGEDGRGSGRGRRRIELRLGLGDAALGCGDANAARGAYAAAMRETGMFEKKRAVVTDREEDGEGSGGVRDEWNECEETYEDGGDERDASDARARTIADYVVKCNSGKVKSMIRGVIDAEVMYRMGRAFQLAGRPRRSLLANRVALLLQPDGPAERSATQIHLSCAEASLAFGDAETALHYFRMVMLKAEEASLSTGDVFCNLATCYRAMGLHDEEARAMNAVCTSSKHRPMRITNMIKTIMYRLSQDKDTAKAIHELESLNEMKETAEGMYSLGRVLLLARDYNAADDALMRACELDPASPKVWLEIGTLYLKGFNVPATAAKAFGRAKELSLVLMEQEEDSYQAESGYGGADENRTKFDDRTEISDARTRAVIGRGDCFEELGQPSKALREWDEVPETAAIQIRKLRIVVWAVVLLQRNFREYKKRIANEISNGVRRPVLAPSSRVVNVGDKNVAPLQSPTQRRRVEAKPVKKKYDSLSRMLTKKDPRKTEVPAIDLLKGFTIGNALSAVPKKKKPNNFFGFFNSPGKSSKKK